MRGAPWTDEEEALLLKRFDGARSLRDLIGLHQRTAAAIVTRLVLNARLVRLGNGYRVLGPMYATYEQIKENQ